MLAKRKKTVETSFLKNLFYIVMDTKHDYCRSHKPKLWVGSPSGGILGTPFLFGILSLENFWQTFHMVPPLWKNVICVYRLVHLEISSRKSAPVSTHLQSFVSEPLQCQFKTGFIQKSTFFFGSQRLEH